MLVLTIILAVIVVGLLIDNVRMRMQSDPKDLERDKMVRPKDDGIFHGSAEPDIVYPDPLPSSMTDQGINWDSDTWGSDTPEMPSNDQSAN